jgi:hypothetical protein
MAKTLLQFDLKGNLFDWFLILAKVLINLD